MRVIKGEWGGRHISFFHLPDYVRPTSNYAKEGMFNILEHNFGIEGKKVLELFAGTGGIGLEFLSLYASQVCMVENSAQMCNVIEKWIDQFRIAKDRCKVYQQDALQFLKQTQENDFDFIFADPPFKKNYAPQLLMLIRERKLLSSKGIFIYEASSRLSPEELCISDWKHMRVASYGDTIFYFYENMKGVAYTNEEKRN